MANINRAPTIKMAQYKAVSAAVSMAQVRLAGILNFIFFTLDSIDDTLNCLHFSVPGTFSLVQNRRKTAGIRQYGSEQDEVVQNTNDSARRGMNNDGMVILTYF